MWWRIGIASWQKNLSGLQPHEKEKIKMNKTTEINKFYYLFPQSVAMIGVDKNVMPAAWHTAISTAPPLYGVLISPKRFTYELLIKAKGFTVSFLNIDQADIIAKTGSSSGRDIDKFQRFKINFVYGEKIKGPLFTDAYAAFECEKFATYELGDHFLFVGKIILLHYREGILNPAGLIDLQKIKTTLYFGKNRYLTIAPESLKIIEHKH